MAWELDGELFSEGSYSATFRGRTMPSTLSPYFVRNSDGTDTSRSGVLSTKGVNVPCYDAGDGLIAEASTINLLNNSRWAGAASGTPGTAPTNWTTVSGGGSFSVEALDIGNAITAQATGAQQILGVSVTLATNTTYCYSFLARANSGTVPLNQIAGFTSLPSGASISAYRLDRAAATGATNLPVDGAYHVVELIVSGTYTGAAHVARLGVGVSSSATGSVTAKYPMFEAGSFRTSYVPTTTSGAVTRAAAYIGNVPLADLGLVSKVNDYSFHVAVKMPYASGILPGGAANVWVAMGDNTANERMYIGQQNSTTIRITKVSSLGTESVDIAPGWAAGDVLNIRGVIAADRMRLLVNASASEKSTAAAVAGWAVAPVSARVNSLQHATSNHGSVTFLGFTLYDTALDDSTLAALDVGAFDFTARRSAQKLVTVGKLMGR